MTYYGENYGTKTLMENLAMLAESVLMYYENGTIDDAAETAEQLMQGSMELWQRMVAEMG